MDEADIASEYQSREMEALLEHRKKKVLTVQDSADHCQECGLEISSARQIAVPDCSLCIQCASWFEQINP